MQLPIQVTFHGMKHSAALEEAVQERAARLEHHFPHLINCRAAIGESAHRKQKGKEFVVRLDMKVSGGEVAVNRDHSEDPYVAVREAFDAARRQLDEHARRVRQRD